MYETVRKRRVKIDMWSSEAHKEDLEMKKGYDDQIKAGHTPFGEFKFLHEKGCGFRTRYGWFAGYGLDKEDTGETMVSFTVAIIENDLDGVELIPVHCITFVS